MGSAELAVASDKNVLRWNIKRDGVKLYNYIHGYLRERDYEEEDISSEGPVRDRFMEEIAKEPQFSHVQASAKEWNRRRREVMFHFSTEGIVQRGRNEPLEKMKRELRITNEMIRQALGIPSVPAKFASIMRWRHGEMERVEQYLKGIKGEKETANDSELGSGPRSEPESPVVGDNVGDGDNGQDEQGDEALRDEISNLWFVHANIGRIGGYSDPPLVECQKHLRKTIARLQAQLTD